MTMAEGSMRMRTRGRSGRGGGRRGRRCKGEQNEGKYTGKMCWKKREGVVRENGDMCVAAAAAGGGRGGGGGGGQGSGDAADVVGASTSAASPVSRDAGTAAAVSPRVDSLDGSKRLSNYIYAAAVTLGGTGFFLTGLSSFVHVNLLPNIHYEAIQTFPQGIVLVFYGTCGLLLATYLWLLCNWNVGGGTNEFDVEKGEVTITRLGYPGKNRRIVVKLLIEDITGIRVEVDDGFQPRRAIYLQSKVRPDICLTPVGTPWTLDRLEETATSLARLIRKPLRGDI